MTNAVLGSLAELKLSDDASPEVYTKIAEVLRVGPIGSTAPEVDVTNLDSTAKEYIGGLPDGASLEFECNWLVGNTQQEALRSAVGDQKNFQMIWNTSPNTQAAFTLTVLGFEIGETTPESQITAMISGRISGAIAWT